MDTFIDAFQHIPTNIFSNHPNMSMNNMNNHDHNNSMNCMNNNMNNHYNNNYNNNHSVTSTHLSSL